MDESGGRYVQVIADGGMGDSGSFVKALAMGADAVMLGAPLARATEAPVARACIGVRSAASDVAAWIPHQRRHCGPLEQILFGPSHMADRRHQLHRCVAANHGVHGLCRRQELPALQLVVVNPYHV